MATTPVDFEAALKFYRDQARNPTQSWDGFCQMLARMSYGIPALYGSAFAQWLGADSKHKTTDLNQAPVGSFLCTKGANPAGHIFIAARPFKNGTSGGWSNDIVRQGEVDKCARNAPHDHWSHTNLGFILEINEHELDLTHGKPPKPKQNKRYEAVKVAIGKMEKALETAQRQKDHHDVRILTREINDLKRLYRNLRHF